jgi:hypothetical protein
LDIGKVKTVDETEHLPSNISTVTDYPKWIALWIMDKYYMRLSVVVTQF